MKGFGSGSRILKGEHSMDAEIRIDHPDLAYLGLSIAIHDPEVDRPVSSSIARIKLWEGFLTRQLLALISDPDFNAFYDLGANIGWHSLVLAAHLRAQGLPGSVVAVEPARSNQARLRRSLVLNGLEDRVQLVAGAVGDHNGQARLDHDPASAGNHHLSGFSWPSDSYTSSEEVPIHRLEDLVRAQGWPLPKLMKMDVQGHELQALAGFGAMLADQSDWILAIEFVPDFWSLEDLIALIAPDAVYQLDEQSLALVPTSPERLRSLGTDWPRRYYDLIVSKGPKARAAIMALPAYCATMQMRFIAASGTGFGGLMESGARWVGPEADCVLEPLRADQPAQEVEISGQILRKLWEGVIVLTLQDGAGQRQRHVLKPQTPFTLRCTLGPEPVRLHFALREKPGGVRRHPQHAFQLSHLQLQVLEGDRLPSEAS